MANLLDDGIVDTLAFVKAAKRAITSPPMRDLKADWRTWTRAERLTAVSFAVVTSTIVAALFIFG
jgi:hypothetical protein